MDFFKIRLFFFNLNFVVLIKTVIILLPTLKIKSSNCVSNVPVEKNIDLDIYRNIHSVFFF